MLKNEKFRTIIDEKEADYTNSRFCLGCGKCCKNCGCFFSPTDFADLSFEDLKEEIDKGYISFHLLQGERLDLEGNNLILRIRNKGEKIYELGINKGGIACSLLFSKGCLIEYRSRPRGGRLLIPQENKHCGDTGYSIIACFSDWEPYQKLLVNLAKYYLVAERNKHYKNFLIEDFRKEVILGKRTVDEADLEILLKEAKNDLAGLEEEKKLYFTSTCQQEKIAALNIEKNILEEDIEKLQEMLNTFPASKNFSRKRELV